MAPPEGSHTPLPGATIHQLKIKTVFDALDKREKLYTHHLAHAAWHGSRVVMRQVSTDSPDIFDFIMDLYHAYGGKWDTLIAQCDITSEELASFLEYAAMFLCNLGNLYGEGDQKFIPDVTRDALEKLADISPKTRAGLNKIVDPLLAVPPFGLGCPSKNAHSGYYPGDEPITRDETAKVSEVMNMKSIGPENTRIRKAIKDGKPLSLRHRPGKLRPAVPASDKTSDSEISKPVFQLLQASAETGPLENGYDEVADGVILVRGDHSQEMAKVCSALEMAKKYAGNDKQTEFLIQYIECFRTGSLKAFQKSQKAWVTDVSARLENIIGFIEPYRDQAGSRSEWEAMVGIADADEVKKLENLANNSTTFIRQVP